MSVTLPGTTIEVSAVTKGISKTLFDGIFAAGGITLSQVSVMTGLEPYDVQNWVKRGWVSKPVNKKYGELQVARILLINLLRPAMQLDKIAALLSYVNGSVEDRSDDIIPEPALYNMVCAGLFAMERERTIHHEFVITLIGAQLEGYEGPVLGAKERLSDALAVMLLNIAAATLMQQADAIYEQMCPMR